MTIDSLSDELNSWYEENCVGGNLSWKVLSRKTGITVSNIAKIARGEIALPKYETAKVLLEAILPHQQPDVFRYLRAKYPQKAYNYVDVKAVPPRANLYSQPSRVAALDDELTYRLYKIALCKKASVASLKKDFGADQVEKRIEILVEKKLVFVEDGVLVRNPDIAHTQTNDPVFINKYFKFNTDIVAGKKVLASHGSANVDTYTNKLLFYHGSFSEDSLKKMVAETIEFIDYLAKKYNDENIEGDVAGFIDITTGRFDAK